MLGLKNQAIKSTIGLVARALTGRSCGYCIFELRRRIALTQKGYLEAVV